MARDPKTLVSNGSGGKSRAGEIRKNPKKKSYRDPKKRWLENVQRAANREVKNIEHMKNGLYECVWCRNVKAESPFPRVAGRPRGAVYSPYHNTWAPRGARLSRRAGCVCDETQSRMARTRHGGELLIISLYRPGSRYIWRAVAAIICNGGCVRECPYIPAKRRRSGEHP